MLWSLEPSVGVIDHNPLFFYVKPRYAVGDFFLLIFPLMVLAWRQVKCLVIRSG